MKRTELKANPDTTRAWQERSRCELRRSPLRKRGRKYATLHAVQFADQSELCRHLPCCACAPWLYGEELGALDYEAADRISDPHHTKSRGRGGKDEDAVPLCITCHTQCSAPGWSEKRVQAEAGVDFVLVAMRLQRHLEESRQMVRKALNATEARYGTDHLF